MLMKAAILTAGVLILVSINVTAADWLSPCALMPAPDGQTVYVACATARLPNHRVVLGDIEGMPFPDSEFDAVVCTEVLEHVPNPSRALEEIRRVLKPRGVLIGSVPARSLIWRLRFLSSTCPHDEPFHNEYLPEEVRQLLNGYEIEKLGYSLLHFSVVFVARA